MRPPSDEVEQHELFVLVGPEDAALLGLLARRRFRRIAVVVAPVAVLCIVAALELVAPGSRPDLVDHTVFAQERHGARAADLGSTELLEPIHVPVRPKRVRAPELRERPRAPEPLPTPAPPEPAIDAPRPGGATLAGAAVSISPKTTAATVRRPASSVAPPPLREPAEDGKWVITLRNGSVFVVDRATITETWATLWVENGVIELPIDYLRAHGWRGH